MNVLCRNLTLPDGWLTEATSALSSIGQPDRGYGYQWWTYPGGSFIDPKRKLVIVSNANWANGARDPAATAYRDAFYHSVQKAVDAESAAPDK